MRIPATAVLLALAAGGQQPEVKFTAAANLVIVNVRAEDRSGQLLEGLTKESFAVF